MRALHGGGAAILTLYWLGVGTGVALGLCVGGALTLAVVLYTTRKPIETTWEKLPALLGEGGGH